MTKRDVKYVVVGTSVGLGAFLVGWFFFRRTKVIPEINPAMVKWEAP